MASSARPRAALRELARLRAAELVQRRCRTCPGTGSSRFQSVSPCRARRSVVTRDYASRRWISAAAEGVPRHRLDRRDRARDGAAPRRRGRARRHVRPERRAGIGEALHVRGRPLRAGRSGPGRRGGGRGARRPRRARQQRRLRRARALRGGDRRGLGRDVAAERDELRARDPGRAAAPRVRRGARSSTSPRPRASGRRPGCRTTRSRRRRCSRSRGSSPTSTRATGSAATRSRPGRPRRTPGSARAASPTSRAATATRCSRRSAPAGRSAGSREPEEIAAVIAFLASERASYVTGAAWSRRRRHRPDHPDVVRARASVATTLR